MGRTTKPRKAYKPKPVGRPVMEQIRRDLILPCRMCIETLRASDDAEALDSARHTITACLNAFYVAAEGRDRQAAIEGLDAMRALIARHERTGVYRCTGPELNALRVRGELGGRNIAVPEHRTAHGGVCVRASGGGDMSLNAMKRKVGGELGMLVRLSAMLNNLKTSDRVTTREAAERLDVDFDTMMEALQELARLGLVTKERLPNGGLLWRGSGWLPAVDMQDPDDAALMKGLIVAGQFLGAR